MERLLENLTRPQGDELAAWVELIDRLRPSRASNTGQAIANLRELAGLLGKCPDLLEAFRGALARLFHERKQVSLYATSGLLPSTGFFSETARRIGGRLLPEAPDTAYLKDVLSIVFHRRDDEIWINAIPDGEWESFVELLLGAAADARQEVAEHLPAGLVEMIEAVRVLSYQISAIGLDPELVRIDPDLEEHESAFLAQNAEVLRYIHHYSACWPQPPGTDEDRKHLVVMLDQCEEVRQRIRRRATKVGTSLTLTFKLERLRQHLQRIARLLRLLDAVHGSASEAAPQMVELFKELVRSECRKHKLSDYLSKNVELLSLRMTESASKTGEHYISDTRAEYFALFRSAALGGVIIALMAGCKILLARQGLAPLTEALAFCLNYGIGFVLIHVLGGTVATKQPAMTANAIAASIGETRGKTRDLENLVELIARTVRSQLGAIVGNVAIAVPFAMLIATVLNGISGGAFVGEAKAQQLLRDVAPGSGAPVFAAVAGVCLFLAGLIAGYYDNFCAYARIPERLRQLRWLQRALGPTRRDALASYVECNLGALAGNFFFGFLLGGVTGLGVLLGLPLDIRHIAFSSAYVGYASAGADFSLPWQVALAAAGGVALIGLMNLVVSFSLSLYVAMRARRITFAQRRTLAGMLLRRFVTRPRDFLVPPREGSPRRGAECAWSGTAIAPDLPLSSTGRPPQDAIELGNRHPTS